MITLSNRVHTFARPESKEKVTEFFTSILGCRLLVSADTAGLPAPISVFGFANGASPSVEFTEEAPDERQARRGARLELSPTIQLR